MYNNWEQFRNLPRIQTLSPQEQARQYFLHQSNTMMENTFSAAAASAAAGAGAGAGGSRNTKTQFRLFGFKVPATNQEDYVLFDVEDNSTLIPFSEDFSGPSILSKDDNGSTYFITRNTSGYFSDNQEYGDKYIFGSMDESGNTTVINDTILSQIGGAVLSITYSSVAGTNNIYTSISPVKQSAPNNGYGVTFDIVVTDGVVSNVSVSNFGDLFKVGDIITVTPEQIGGASHSLVITVTETVAQSCPTSMFYDGESFVYTDRLLFIDYNNNLWSKIVRIDVTGSASLVAISDGTDSGLYLTGLVNYGDVVLSTSVPYGAPIALLGLFDMNLAQFIQESISPITLNNVPNVSINKVWFIIDIINVNSRIYTHLYCNDKELSQLFTCIAELNVETYEAEFLYFTPYNTDYLNTNIIGI